MWRCVSRLDYGKKYCRCSPSIEETVLQSAVAEAVTQKAHQKGNPAEHLLMHIEMYRNARNNNGVQAEKNRLYIRRLIINLSKVCLLQFEEWY